MPPDRDIVDIEGVATPRPAAPRTRGPRQRFLSVWYRCCRTYGRLYRNRAGTAYEGRCPRCGSPVRALIGPHGTTRRTFEAR